ncbi:putative methyltransferase [Sulfitobacter noctilucicola]|uniref:SAM-dependent methyltransferase n=1 Tax=Sulfitobacter noctilucicola TaxID=1342301 RepID=A0A7W6M6I3_9RHOB|nr:class I SAM-dependent methyltransferase [Sulfitobacter noctilucicola]KIN62176.1 putative methyltransferase [Sulfitobacter noctilucicola]MBB4173306.1 SAM-dependent methyltransferase [Sulfitobacter noctilucicola]
MSMTEQTTHSIPVPSSVVVQHPHFGPAMPNLNWVPAPRYLMRRDLLLRIFARQTPGHILEIGCGAGSLLCDLSEQGFTSLGVDQSPSALALARTLAAENENIEIAATTADAEAESFDYLTAFEVLEHIEDDHAALADWSRYLRPEGTLVFSVPAHPSRWNAADEWAGHFRRYTRDDLHALAKGAGYEVTEIQSYGFPIANAMEKLGARLYARQSAGADRADMDKLRRTEESGSDRKLLTKLWPIYSFWPLALTFRAMLSFQRLFAKGDRGIGYIVVARKT